MKTCSKCGGIVEPGRRGRQCRACRNEGTAAWRRNNLEKARASVRAATARWRALNPEESRAQSRKHNWRTQGIDMSSTEYDRLLEAQGGKCAVCRSAEPGGRGRVFHVDHDHDYHHVRGLLCSRCNQALGLLRDSPQLLRAALKYLEQHQSRLKLAGGN